MSELLWPNGPHPSVPTPADDPSDRPAQPPLVASTSAHVRIVFAGVVLADSHDAVLVREPGRPPTCYVPPEDVLVEHLRRIEHQTRSEAFGRALYYTVVAGDREAAEAAWCYPDPPADFSLLARAIAFDADQMDEFTVDAQPAEA